MVLVRRVGVLMAVGLHRRGLMYCESPSVEAYSGIAIISRLYVGSAGAS
jgi:hypothetical protein